MYDLRSEIRAAFEREQAGHAPAAARRDVVEAVTARARPSRNFQWVAVVAAALLGLLVVAGLMSTRFAPHASVPATTPKASVDYGPPPAGVNLLYVYDPSNPSRLIGYDWSGTPRGTIKLVPPMSVEMAPNGQAFRASATGGKGSFGGNGTFLDRLGQVVIPWQGGVTGFGGGMWADDNRHVCSISLNQQTSTSTLYVQQVDEAPKQVAVIANNSIVGPLRIGVAACSIRNNLAIVVGDSNTAPVIGDSNTGPKELWVIRLSDGAVISHRTYKEHLISTVAASADGVYVAENSSKIVSTVIVSRQGADYTIIRRVSDGQQVAALNASDQVLGFSSDDRLVLAMAQPDKTRPWGQLTVIQWQTGSVVWSHGGSEILDSFIAQFDGTGFAIALQAPTHGDQKDCGTTSSSPCPGDDVVIVHADGTETKIPGRYLPAW
jgi:hypothetical protein